MSIPRLAGYRNPSAPLHRVGAGPDRANGRGADWYGAGTGLAVGALGLTCVLIAWLLRWQGPDWPAQVYRAELFRSHGWLLWDSGWYGGQYLLNYSVLFPALAATIGLYGAAAASAAVAAWAFERLLRTTYGAVSFLPAVLFALATVIPVLFGQLPFLAGEAAGLLVLVLARARRRELAFLLAPCCPLLSPVAGALLILILSAWAMTSPPGRRIGLAALAGITALPLIVVGHTFPVSGTSPFWGGDFALLLALCGLGLLIVPRAQRTLRAGLVLYGIAAIVLFVVPNPLGGNYVRLASAVAPSLIIAASWVSKRRAIVLLALPLMLWQWSPAFGLMHPMSQDPSASSTYFRPLLAALARQTGADRVEIPLTLDHWETAFVAPHLPLARGWERQTDVANNPIFYGGRPLTAASYRRWLDATGVTFVALPDVALDYSSTSEAHLLATPPSYLQPVWHNEHWRVWRVLGSPGLVSGPATLVSLRPDGFTLDATSSGRIVVRVHYTPLWSIARGQACAAPTADGWTALTVTAKGRIEVKTALADHAMRCPSTRGK